MIKSRISYKTLVITMVVLLLTILSTLTYAWFALSKKTEPFVIVASKIDVSYDIYLDGTLLELEDFSVNTGTNTMVKSGAFSINVTDFSASNYIDKLRIDIKVNSTIDTYLRISIIDALTLATVDFEGNKGEVSIVDQPINYAITKSFEVNGIMYNNLIDAEVALGSITSNDVVTEINHWYNNRLNDGYYYYPELITRDKTSSELSISFIEAYDGDQFSTKSFGYTLQFVLLVEAIQAGNDAPLYNWQLPNPPWGGSWA